jgi:hypothetical protein
MEAESDGKRRTWMGWRKRNREYARRHEKKRKRQNRELSTAFVRAYL